MQVRDNSGTASGWAAAAPFLLFLFALGLNSFGIHWGLPNGSQTWAADSIRPTAPLSIFNRIVFEDGWNSGWFWFKYPLGHVFILAAAYAPFLAWQVMTGGLGKPQSEYPFGFADPESALAGLALIGRFVSAAMGAGTVVLVYLCVVRSFGRAAAIASALVTAFCYPFLYYSHTSNVEVPCVFWMMLCVLAAVRLIEGESARRWWLLLALGAAMSVSTKELVAGAFLGVACVVSLRLLTDGRGWAGLLRGGLTAAACFAGVCLLANNALLNPTGFLNRLGFLTQTLDPQVALQYAPYYFPIDLGGARGWAPEWAQFSKAATWVITSLGWPGIALAAAGVAAALKERPWWAALVLLTALTFYLVGVRAMLSLSLRYVLPISVLACMFAGIGLARLAAVGSQVLPRRAMALAAGVFLIVYGWDVNRMLAYDGRYAAEQWLRANLGPGHSVEVYQRATYLPRFPAEASVAEIDYEQRGVQQFRSRNPDYVVLSSAGLSGVTVRYKDDWNSAAPPPDQYQAAQRSITGQVMNYKRTANVAFLESLTTGSLGYRPLADFVVHPWIPRPLIQSLNPRIMIYGRDDAQTPARNPQGDRPQL